MEPSLNHYRIIRALGSGGMGEVFLGEDTRLKRNVAIKILPPAFAAEPERRERFEREAQAVAALNHPNIVTIHGVEQSGDTHYIVMELVDGKTLAEVTPADGLPLARLLEIAVPLTDAVAAAHDHGIVHRDLKPANVMLGAHERVKVLDFGLAKLRESASAAEATMLPARAITGEGRIVGTVAYMSPEQAQGMPVDGRSDVFSLGVMLYEMATGERPFKGDTSLSILSAILRDVPAPLTERNPALPRELSRIVRRCLAKDPERRYQSAKDLRNDLDELKQSSQSGELQAAAGPEAARKGRVWPIVVGGVAIAAAIATAAMLWRGPAAPAAAATPVLSFTRLTMHPGVAQDPSLSPDGKWVVYVNGASGNQDIYLQSTSGQTAINLTKDAGLDDTQPAFSPDGDSIVFRSERDGGGLFVMGRTGESVRRLTRNGFHPAWFPDGRQVVFASQSAPQVESRGTEAIELWIVNASGEYPQRLYAGDAVQPQVSPNSRRIAFWSVPRSAPPNPPSLNRDIWTVAIDGTGPVRVTTDGGYDWNPVWSPDGRFLYFLSNRSGSMNLWRIAIDETSGVTSGSPQPLTVPAQYIRSFSLSADGRLATYATFAATNNVARVPFDSRSGTIRGPIEPITSGPRDFARVDVSPDGQQLVVGSSPRQQEDLFLIAADGSTRQLTNDAARDRHPRWSPDGQRILFYTDRDGGLVLMSIDRDGGGLRQLTQVGAGGRSYPVPSRDGLKVAASGAGQLFVYDARDFSKAPDALPRIPDELRQGIVSLSEWSADGRLLAGSSLAGAWVYSFETGTYRRVAQVGEPKVSWLPDSRRLVVSRQGRLVLVDWQSGAAREVFAVPGETVTAPRVSDDGSYLYFVHGSPSGDIWMARFGEK